MNEAILDTYLNVLQEDGSEYMAEGLREFVAKFDKAMIKRFTDKMHRAFTKGDADSFNDVLKQSVKVTKKMPKYKDVVDTTGKFKEDNPDYNRSVELSKKVLRNTFKIKDKAQLELVGNAVGLTSWVKTKGGRKDMMRETKITLQELNNKVTSVYDTGFENYETSTAEEEEMQKKMMAQSKKQEKTELIVVGVVISMLVAAIIWIGVAFWGFATSPTVGIILSILLILGAWFKVIMWAVGIGAPIALGAIAYTKGSA
jgi:hypothetical protein